MFIENKFEVKRFSKLLIDDFLILYKEIFKNGIKLSREGVLHLYGDLELYIGYIAFDKDKPIGFYGVLPFYFKYNDNIIKVAQSVNNMVHPEYRKHNLFFHLTQMTFSLAKEEDIKFIYGWPNTPKLYSSLLKWIDLGAMQLYSFPVTTFPLAKIIWKIPILKSFYHSYIKIITGKVRSLNFENTKFKLIIDNNFYIPRTEEYIKYKKATGAFLIKINNINVWVNIDYRLKIGDIDDISLKEFDQLLKSLKKISFWLGITEIIYSVDKSSTWNEILMPKYNPKNELQLLYYPLNYQYKIQSAHFTMGDYDTY